jgi:hypothetical protein
LSQYPFNTLWLYLYGVDIAQEGLVLVVVVAGVGRGGGIAGCRGKHVQGGAQQTLRNKELYKVRCYWNKGWGEGLLPSINIHRKKNFLIFPSPAGMSLTKLSLGGNNLYMTSLFPPRESFISDVLAGDRNIEKVFLRCNVDEI